MSNKQEQVSTEETLHAMEIYLNEYIHRDTHMWSQTYRFFFAALIVMLLPNLTERVGITIPEKFSLYTKIFPIMGIILSVVFLHVALLLAKRFAAISKTYSNLINQLPEELRRISIKDMPIKLLNYSPNYLLLFSMFLVLLTLGITLLI